MVSGFQRGELPLWMRMARVVGVADAPETHDRGLDDRRRLKAAEIPAEVIEFFGSG